MPTGPVLLAFILTAAVVLLVPGPGIAYVVTRSIEGGRRAGLTSALGVSTGAFIHAIAAATGLGALLASTDWAFTTVKLAGAAYLVLLGIRQLRSTRVELQPCPADPASGGLRRAPAPTLRLFTDGLVVNVLNPKTVLFYLAFLPQFVDPSLGSPSTQLLVFALCFVPVAYLVDATYALLAARIGTGVGKQPRTRARINRGTAAVYLGLAAFAVLS